MENTTTLKEVLEKFSILELRLMKECIELGLEDIDKYCLNENYSSDYLLDLLTALNKRDKKERKNKNEKITITIKLFN